MKEEKYEIEEEKSGPRGKAITGEKNYYPRKAGPPSVMAKRSCGVMITNMTASQYKGKYLCGAS